MNENNKNLIPKDLLDFSFEKKGYPKIFDELKKIINFSVDNNWSINENGIFGFNEEDLIKVHKKDSKLLDFLLLHEFLHMLFLHPWEDASLIKHFAIFNEAADVVVDNWIFKYFIHDKALERILYADHEFFGKFDKTVWDIYLELVERRGLEDEGIKKNLKMLNLRSKVLDLIVEKVLCVK